jgi:hypothetical protein
MNEIIPIIRDFGFPVFVAAFVLIRIEPTLKKLEVTCANILLFLQNHTP